MADYILYALILAIAVIVTKYSVPFILSIASIPHHLVTIVNLALYFAIFAIVVFALYFLPQPRGLVSQIFAEPNIVSVTPTSTPTKVLAQKPSEPTWTPTKTPLPAPTWTPTRTPTQNSIQPTWTPTKTPLPAPTWTPTKTPPPAPTWTPTKTPRPPAPRSTSTNTPKPAPSRTPTPYLTPTVPSDIGMIILQGAYNHEGLETQVQWLDGNGNWNNVENWHDQLDDTGRISWEVWSRSFNTGPFRWVVYNRDGSTRFASQPFYLPGAGQEYLINMN